MNSEQQAAIGPIFERAKALKKQDWNVGKHVVIAGRIFLDGCLSKPAQEFCTCLTPDYEVFHSYIEQLTEGDDEVAYPIGWYHLAAILIYSEPEYEGPYVSVPGYWDCEERSIVPVPLEELTEGDRELINIYSMPPAECGVVEETDFPF